MNDRRSMEMNSTMEAIEPAPSRTVPNLGEKLGNVALAAVLAFSGAFQMMKVVEALRDGDHILALYQTLIGLSTFIMVLLVVIRRPALSRDAGWASKFVAAIGSFIIIPLGAISLTWSPSWLLAVTSGLLILSYVWIIWALLTLRRSFSVFAEARKLVTHGPYSIVRHPLYAAYFLTYFCSAAPRIGIPAVAILVIGIAAEVKRSKNEERVLSAAFPEYRDYARTTPAFFPFARLFKSNDRANAWPTPETAPQQ